MRNDRPEKWGQSAFGAAISIGLFLSCAANRTEAEATPSLSELLEDRSVQVRVCNDAVATAAMCKEIALALTQNKVTAITPAVVVPDVDDDRMASLGRDCPPTGADMKGDPYLPFELEYDGWQAVPRGPFEVLKIAPHYPKWREFNIVSSAGYDYKNQRLSTGQPLSWKAYYMVPARLACPPILIDALFHRGREQASRQKVSDAVVVWKGWVLIVNAQEEPTASNRYYVSVSLIPDDPRVTGQSGGAGRIQLLSFIAQ